MKKLHALMKDEQLADFMAIVALVVALLNVL